MPSHGALYGDRYRVIVSTDIGGSDPDDFQSMAHFLLYSDLFDVEGLISSPWGEGRAIDIHRVIDAYEIDYPRLKRHSEAYPHPNALRAVTAQGEVDFAPWKGWSAPTEGSKLIIQAAKKDDPRPLYVLIWGLLEDLAQALHDAPEIQGKLRVHYIGGPNKKWGQNAYAYIRREFPDLWMIENNSTYRGWFVGGDQCAPWGNETFIDAFVRGHGALGGFFADLPLTGIKMGDTPTVAWLLAGDPEHPEQESWGGSYAPVFSMPESVCRYMGAEFKPVEVFSVTELHFLGPSLPAADDPAFQVEIRGQSFDGYNLGGGDFGFRFVPKEAGTFEFSTHSGISEMDGLTGSIAVVPERPETRRAGRLTHSWSDILDAERAEGPHAGAQTINRWRREYLASFAERLSWLEDA